MRGSQGLNLLQLSFRGSHGDLQRGREYGLDRNTTHAGIEDPWGRGGKWGPDPTRLPIPTYIRFHVCTFRPQTSREIKFSYFL